jgi:deferrochelatase/peroxidase EfeB
VRSSILTIWDGVSQPRFFRGEKEETPPSIVLERDFLAGDADALGTYVVYRKPEQNVKAFRAAETALAAALGLDPADRERAEAMIVGRFRDGTPLARMGQNTRMQTIDATSSFASLPLLLLEEQVE